MGWARRQRFAERRAVSLWFVPSIALMAGIAVAVTMLRLDRAYRWELLGFSASGAQSFLGVLSSALVTFIGLVFSVITIAIQFAAGNLSPRIVKPLLASKRSRFMLGTATFTLGYTLSLLLRIDESIVPQAALAVSIPLMVVSIFGFIILIDITGSQLRFANIYAKTLDSGLQAIHRTFPLPLIETKKEIRFPDDSSMDNAKLIVYRGKSGVIHDFARDELLAHCCRHKVSITALRAVGDYIYPGVPLFLVSHPILLAQDEWLQESVLVGRERLVDHDPAYAIRLLVDIAIRALSPAVNDPTTAVGCLDRIEFLLHAIGGKQLDVGDLASGDGIIRLRIPMPTWNDYVALACNEIRYYGSESFQVTARLKTMLEDLHASLPPVRTGVLRDELAILAREVPRHFRERADQERAMTSDRQGLGGASLRNGNIHG
ncbi:MAG: DUF2254 domain-containing protein [Myxococcota bacterium]